MNNIFLGNPPENVKKWIKEHQQKTPTIGGYWIPENPESEYANFQWWQETESVRIWPNDYGNCLVYVKKPSSETPFDVLTPDNIGWHNYYLDAAEWTFLDKTDECLNSDLLWYGEPYKWVNEL